MYQSAERNTGEKFSPADDPVTKAKGTNGGALAESGQRASHPPARSHGDSAAEARKQTTVMRLAKEALRCMCVNELTAQLCV